MADKLRQSRKTIIGSGNGLLCRLKTFNMCSSQNSINAPELILDKQRVKNKAEKTLGVLSTQSLVKQDLH